VNSYLLDTENAAIGLIDLMFFEGVKISYGSVVQLINGQVKEDHDIETK
jgi:hypothetical protein